jgi:hypothetical protein
MAGLLRRDRHAGFPRPDPPQPMPLWMKWKPGLEGPTTAGMNPVRLCTCDDALAPVAQGDETGPVVRVLDRTALTQLSEAGQLD